MKKFDKTKFIGNRTKIELLLSELNQTLDLYYENINESEFESYEKLS